MRVKNSGESVILSYTDIDRQHVYQVNTVGEASPENSDWDFGLFILVDDGQIVDVVNHTVYSETYVEDWQFREVDAEIVVD